MWGLGGQKMAILNKPKDLFVPIDALEDEYFLASYHVVQDGLFLCDIEGDLWFLTDFTDGHLKYRRAETPVNILQRREFVN